VEDNARCSSAYLEVKAHAAGSSSTDSGLTSTALHLQEHITSRLSCCVVPMQANVALPSVLASKDFIKSGGLANCLYILPCLVCVLSLLILLRDTVKCPACTQADRCICVFFLFAEMFQVMAGTAEARHPPFLLPSSLFLLLC